MVRDNEIVSPGLVMNSLLAILVASCLSGKVAFSNCLHDSLPKIIIINSFDSHSLDARKGKKEFFKELADSLQTYLLEEINNLDLGKATAIPGMIKSNNENLFDSLLKANNAVFLIQISSLEVYFEESGEEEHTTSDGK